MRLLLISSSLTGAQPEYLQHCSDHLLEFLGDIGQVLFIPYACKNLDAYTKIVRPAFEALGCEVHPIHRQPNPRRALESFGALFVGGGNTFLLLKRLYEERLVSPLREAVLEGTPFIGVSAGANIAGPNIGTTNDMPVVHPPSLKSLGLIRWNVNPHFVDVDPSSQSMMESRETRIREYLEHNRNSVIALREGALLRVEGSAATLHGHTGGRVFPKRGPVRNVVDGDSVRGAISRRRSEGTPR